MLGRIRSLLAKNDGPYTMMDAHDDWNLLAIGGLNLAHVAWWFGLVATNGPALQFLFYADCAYMLADCCWLLFVPSCVMPRVRGTLLVHHLTCIACMPVAAGNYTFMKHLLRTWSVEVHSWNHIASRRFSKLTFLSYINKPLFVMLRLIGFPLTWFAYARDRVALCACGARGDATRNVALAADGDAHSDVRSDAEMGRAYSSRSILLVSASP